MRLNDLTDILEDMILRLMEFCCPTDLTGCAFQWHVLSVASSKKREPTPLSPWVIHSLVGHERSGEPPPPALAAQPIGNFRQQRREFCALCKGVISSLLLAEAGFAREMSPNWDMAANRKKQRLKLANFKSNDNIGFCSDAT